MAEVAHDGQGRRALRELPRDLERTQERGGTATTGEHLVHQRRRDGSLRLRTDDLRERGEHRLLVAALERLLQRWQVELHWSGLGGPGLGLGQPGLSAREPR